MRFVLFVEGHTEQRAVPAFLKRWLDPQLNHPVGITPVRFEGWAEFHDDVAKKARLYLEGRQADKVIAVIGLLDLYGPTFYPDSARSADERAQWAKSYFEDKIDHDKFRQFFAVHEIEAWLLSQPTVFPQDIRSALEATRTRPETVNFDNPPSRRLEQLYMQAIRKKYKKLTGGINLFSKLDPAQAYAVCPNLKAMLDEMLALAKTIES